jgi:hypothetical protein
MNDFIKSLYFVRIVDLGGSYCQAVSLTRGRENLFVKLYGQFKCKMGAENL